jgi:drug/metabolite transporter (DMT)-like permease
MQARGFDYAILALGVAAVSTAALFIREADAPALVIAAYRLTIASLPLLLLSAVQRRPVVPGDRTNLGLTLLAGVCLALHFAFWIASVKQTSIITSVVLVTAQPLFVALASSFLLHERVTSGAWLGIAIAAAGAAVMVADDLGQDTDTLVGDLFAILGAIFAAAYFLIGRRLRATGTSWLSYVTLAYSTSAIVLIAMAAIAGETFFGYSERTYAFLMFLALVPQLIGHTALNRSLGYLPAVAVTIAVLGEPVGATVLAAVVLEEWPTPAEVGGAILILVGVYFGLRAPTAAPVRNGPVD